MTEDRVGIARRIIDSNCYLTLATADADGRPWATPVWFASERYTDFIWLSRTSTRHSANIARRPEVGIVVFDSTVPIDQGQAVYVEAVAGQVPASGVEAAVAVFSARSVAAGGRPWQLADVVAPASFRLYRARGNAHYVLDAHDSRVPVDPAPTW
ncbi:pyridoxamine 5'-phosphate oxidase family protein [Phytoactinopolyspora alkaliphila]|uniref:Pyridoxamine 5'-phosphate oxidase family protein n=1 Tax=Phytoactinopolyspora alkaliphila TaxID=1783498 RepID=A0A6N9YQZ1_9ACTN|nr:pyridoxamine 5'-phosphate oxidase family protein [Phytoactinopolyspora alkaliphila]NED97229.1 pyridoxamine 5'-phosphate oxidase family protein [Phytoactinopolyspora alkaliphila]